MKGKTQGQKVKDVSMFKDLQDKPELPGHEEEAIRTILKEQGRKWNRILGWWEVTVLEVFLLCLPRM